MGWWDDFGTLIFQVVFLRMGFSASWLSRSSPKKVVINFWQSWANDGSCPKRSEKKDLIQYLVERNYLFLVTNVRTNDGQCLLFHLLLKYPMDVTPIKATSKQKSFLCWRCTSTNHIFQFITFLTTSPTKLLYKRLLKTLFAVWIIHIGIFMAGQPTPPNVPPPRNKGLIRPY